MYKKTILSTFLLTSVLYYIIPIAFLKFYTGTSDKAGFFLMLFYIFSSFTINILVSYFFERKILVPILTILLALPIFIIYNSSAIVIIIIITIFSFLAYFISSLVK